MFLSQPLDTSTGASPINVIESDLITGLRFIALNLDSYGLSSKSITVVTEAAVNEALFDIFFEFMDLSILQIPFENFFIHHQSFSNNMVFTDAPPAAVNALYEATDCSEFDCLKNASVEQLLSVDQSQFVLTSEWTRQIDRLFPLRTKLGFAGFENDLY